jgi:hypothetical protein
MYRMVRGVPPSLWPLMLSVPNPRFVRPLLSQKMVPGPDSCCQRQQIGRQMLLVSSTCLICGTLVALPPGKAGLSWAASVLQLEPGHGYLHPGRGCASSCAPVNGPFPDKSCREPPCCLSPWLSMNQYILLKIPGPYFPGQNAPGNACSSWLVEKWLFLLV